MTTIIDIGILLVGIGSAFAIVRSHFRNTTVWTKSSEKLARDYGIALRPDVAVRVAAHLRRQYVVSMIVLIPVFLLINLSVWNLAGFRERPRDAVGYLLTLIALPLLGIAVGLTIVVPAWNKARAQRVTHLVRPTPWQIFTNREWVMVGIGVLITGIGGCWGLWHVAAGGWVPVWLITLTASALVWRWAAQLILTRPAQASDDTELGWDDVLRHKETRELTIGAAWLPALTVFLMDWLLTGTGSLLPFYGAIGAAVLVSRMFRQGRTLWRQSWDGLGPA